MKLRLIHAAAAFALALSAPVFAPATAKADVIIGIGYCVDINGGSWEATMQPCDTTKGTQTTFVNRYGEQRWNNRCMNGDTNKRVTFVACNGSQAQKWVIRGNGELANETGQCARIPGGALDGAPLIMTNCGSGARFLMARKGGRAVGAPGQPRPVGAFYANNQPIPYGQTIAPGSALIGQDGNSFIVSGGSMVAAGGGNMVAAGGGNLVSPGGGN